MSGKERDLARRKLKGFEDVEDPNLTMDKLDQERRDEHLKSILPPTSSHRVLEELPKESKKKK